MKRIVLIALFMGIVSLITTTSYGQARVDKRQKAQRVRIAEGRQDGEITNGEAAMLNKQQRHIRRSERRAKADGELSPREKMKLERKQNRANRNIRRAKNNPTGN